MHSNTIASIGTGWTVPVRWRRLVESLDPGSRAEAVHLMQLMIGGGGALIVTLVNADIWPTESAYTAVYWMFVSWTGFHIFSGSIQLLYMVARAVAGKVTSQRRQSLQNVEAFWHFTTFLALVSLAMIHLWPRMI